MTVNSLQFETIHNLDDSTDIRQTSTSHSRSVKLPLKTFLWLCRGFILQTKLFIIDVEYLYYSREH